MASPKTSDRPLRRDAERNRQRILEAANEVFAERGLCATLDDVAARAGVGVGTVYRRFPDKDALIDEIFDERIEELAALAERQLGAEDPWEGLCGFLEGSVELQAANRAVREIVHHPERGRERVSAAREHIAPRVGALLARAQESGQARADLAVTDIGLSTLMLVTLIDSTGAIRPNAWRRHLALMIDALRASPEHEPLPGPALSLEEFDEALRTPRS